jgi:hypothetical protein
MVPKNKCYSKCKALTFAFWWFILVASLYIEALIALADQFLQQNSPIRPSSKPKEPSFSINLAVDVGSSAETPKSELSLKIYKKYYGLAWIALEILSVEEATNKAISAKFICCLLSSEKLEDPRMHCAFCDSVWEKSSLLRLQV